MQEAMKKKHNVASFMLLKVMTVTDLLSFLLSYYKGYCALFLFLLCTPWGVCVFVRLFIHSFSPMCLLRSFSCSKRVGVCWISRLWAGVAQPALGQCESDSSSQ